MAFPTVLAKTIELVAAIQAAGALGAELRLRQMGVDGDHPLRPALQGVVDALGVGSLDELEPTQLAIVVGQLTYALQESLDLLGAPDRAPGWSYTDPAILQERGRGSRHMAHNIARMAKARPAFAALLEGESRFLDIGTGVGWIAIEAAKLWPRMQIVGIDILEPALAVAERNVAAEGVRDRVTLRRQSITDLNDEDAYELVWLPSMFLTDELLELSLTRLARALVPGGVLVAGMFSTPPVAYGEAVRAVLTIRSGGHPWRPADLGARLESHGLADVEHVTFGATTEVLLARKPSLMT